MCTALGIHGLSTCEVILDDVAVGADALLGTEHAGFRQAFVTLDREKDMRTAYTYFEQLLRERT